MVLSWSENYSELLMISHHILSKVLIQHLLLPDIKTRMRIFQIHTSTMTLVDDVNLEDFVMTKDEFSGADIKAICTDAGLLALRERRMKIDSRIYIFYNQIRERAPALEVQMERLTDWEQERTRNHVPLSTLLQIDPDTQKSACLEWNCKSRRKCVADEMPTISYINVVVVLEGRVIDTKLVNSHPSKTLKFRWKSVSLIPIHT